MYQPQPTSCLAFFQVLIVRTRSGISTGSTFMPIDELKREDGDLSLFWLSSYFMMYTEPIDDPFFSAHVVLDKKANPRFYSPDRWANVIGCVDQHQFCNPNNRQCTPLGNMRSLSPASQTIGLNRQQNYTALLLQVSLVGTDIFDSIS